MFLARFSATLHRKNYLTNAFKSIFRDESFKQCSKIARFLRVLGGCTHACARARASEKLRARLGNTLGALGERSRTTKFGTCRIPYHEALVRASGKDLAQGQVALLYRPNLTVLFRISRHSSTSPTPQQGGCDRSLRALILRKHPSNEK